MPSNPLAIITRWLASHLVILTLLGFVVVGMQVFGWLDWPPSGLSGRSASGSAPGSDKADVAAEATAQHPGHGEQVSAPRRTAQEQTSSDVTESTATVRPSRSPKLIGGSLPVYDMQRASPETRTPSGQAGDGFRPPAEGLGGPAPQMRGRDELLQAARRLFWNGDFEAAEAAYLDVVGAYPADPDAFGELGNLYQAMSKHPQALDAYYEAGIRLKAAGDLEKTYKIIEILNGENDPRGAELER